MIIGLHEKYFEYLVGMIDLEGNDLFPRAYDRLLRYLFSRDFYYILPMDENRIKDGLVLRSRFERTYGVDLTSSVSPEWCSILELMVALADRMETAIMSDENHGNRTGMWFWSMISSLELEDMTDRQFDIQKVNYILSRFLNREYEPNGRGGLFTVKNTDKDFREVEIWYQMNAFLKEVYYGNGKLV